MNPRPSFVRVFLWRLALYNLVGGSLTKSVHLALIDALNSRDKWPW